MVRIVLALLGAFIAATICWIAWGVATPGDFFANGSAAVVVTIPIAAALGAWVGSRGQTSRTRSILIGAGVLCLLFWALAPNGWWAAGPPPASSKP